MSTAVHISLAEYMQTDYEPDCEYIDGVIEERNVGKKKHSRTQTLLSAWLVSREQLHSKKVLIEQRVQTSPSRVRIPDICLVEPDDRDEVTRQPPSLWVEIVSPEDRWSRIQIRLDDILSFGVPTIWIVDPYLNEAWTVSPGKPVEPIQDGRLRCPALQLEVALSQILPNE